MAKAVGPYIKVKVMKLEKKTLGGIYLPENAVEAQTNAAMFGEVLELGPHAYQYVNGGYKPWCAVGDTIYFSPYEGQALPSRKTDDHYIRMILCESVRGIVEDDDYVLDERQQLENQKRATA